MPATSVAQSTKKSVTPNLFCAAMGFSSSSRSAEPSHRLGKRRRRRPDALRPVGEGPPDDRLAARALGRAEGARRASGSRDFGVRFRPRAYGAEAG